jgi:hypothetical protein
MNSKDITLKLKELIRVCGVMDVYRNNNEGRFNVIKQVIESKSKQIACLQKGIKLMNESAEWKYGKW